MPRKPTSGNRKHHEIRESIEDASRILEQLKCFLLADTGDPRHAERQRDQPDEENRVHRRSKARMQLREPRRQQVVPTRDHRHARSCAVNAMLELAIVRAVMQQNRHACRRNARAGLAETDAQHLRNRTDQIDLIDRHERQHGMVPRMNITAMIGAAIIVALPIVSLGILRLPGEHRDVFESTQAPPSPSCRRC